MCLNPSCAQRLCFPSGAVSCMRNHSMSVIAAVRKTRRIVIAADSQDNFGDLRPPPDNHSAFKLREIDAAWIGCSGWAIYDDLLGHYLRKRSTRAVLGSREDVFDFFLKFWRAIRTDYPLVNGE